MKAIGFLKSEQDVLAETTTSVVVEAVHHAEHKHKGERCERCEQYTVVVQNGCSVCTSCLTSKCG
jgi:hypothetical protein